MGKYSEEFKKAMIQKLAVPGAISAASLSTDVNVPQATLSRWLRECGNIYNMKKKNKLPRDWTPENKLKAIIEYENISDEEERGAFLRKNGLYSSYIEIWKKEFLEALTTTTGNRKKKKDPKDLKIKGLEKELWRKEKALAETAALLVLKKKADLIWGEQEDEQ